MAVDNLKVGKGISRNTALGIFCKDLRGSVVLCKTKSYF